MTADSEALSREARLVRAALTAKGLETPCRAVSDCDPTQQKSAIAAHVRAVMEILGLDLTDDSLKATPERVARMYVDELFAGLDYRRFPRVSVFDNHMHFDEMVKISHISLTSTCEHHLVIMDGEAKIAYMPGAKLIGLSKISRIAQFFAARPQLQERLTQQIHAALQALLDTRNVAVSVTATHYCVKARGAKDTTAVTTTTALGGLFKNNSSSRHEFLTD